MMLVDINHDVLLTGVPSRSAHALPRPRPADGAPIIGDSDAICRVWSMIGRVAPTDATVLIQGETGTGKELIARALHDRSRRVRGPYVIVNCATLGESLLESELFGYERGAFTGAESQKRGKIEIADGGTVFLDEIGELGLGLQAKLLRLLQEREFDRVGGTRPVRVDIRVIAATNRDLRESVLMRGFRADLYFRLNVIGINLPPLRDRRSDIPLLTNHFLAHFSQAVHRPLAGVSAAAMDRLIAYDWPGNVRELENVIERAVVLGEHEHVTVEDLPESIIERAPGVPPQEAHGFHDRILAEKKRIVIEAFRESRYRYNETARRLKLHPNYLHRLIRSLDLKATLESERGQ